MFFFASPSFQKRNRPLAKLSISVSCSDGTGGDDELNAGLLLELVRFRLDSELRRRRKNMGVVDDAAGERGKVERGEGERRQQEQDASRARLRAPSIIVGRKRRGDAKATKEATA